MSLQSPVYAALPKALSAEGFQTKMYLDVSGNVTVGMGNMIEPVDIALGPYYRNADGSSVFVHDSDGNPATDDEIRAAYTAIKARQDLTNYKANSPVVKGVTSLHIDPATIPQVVQNQANAMVSTLESRFPSIDSWPADGQLGVVRLSWATGPSAGQNGLNMWAKPVFDALGQTPPDFAGAASAAVWAGQDPRTKATLQTLFKNADAVQNQSLDVAVLNWPTAVFSGEGLSEVLAALGGGSELGGGLSLAATNRAVQGAAASIDEGASVIAQQFAKAESTIEDAVHFMENETRIIEGNVRSGIAVLFGTMAAFGLLTLLVVLRKGSNRELSR
jgi:hypothetical protein